MALEGILRHLHGAKDDQGSLRPLIEQLDDLSGTLRVLVTTQQALGPAHERLEQLELSRVRWEAQCEGLLLKAEGKHNAAKAAEMRERQLKKSYAKQLVDPFPEEGEEAEGSAVLALDAPAGEAEGVRPVYMGLATNNKKALAQAAKWGS